MAVALAARYLLNHLLLLIAIPKRPSSKGVSTNGTHFGAVWPLSISEICYDGRVLNFSDVVSEVLFDVTCSGRHDDGLLL